MKISVVRQEDYRINEIPKSTILEKSSEHVPNVGDIIKVGHTLNGFEAFKVDNRVFRSKVTKAEDDTAFHEVVLLVSELEH